MNISFNFKVKSTPQYKPKGRFSFVIKINDRLQNFSTILYVFVRVGFKEIMFISIFIKLKMIQN